MYRKILSEKYKIVLNGASVRKATHDDYEAVMKISKGIYSGMDYLPDLFHTYIDNPLKFNFVCEKDGTIGMDYLPELYHTYIDNPLKFNFVCVKDGTIIAFGLLFVVDEGTSVINRALRVHPGYRGQGLASLLLDKGLLDVETHYPEIKRMVWTSNRENDLAKTLAWNKALKMTFKKGRVSAEIDSKKLQTIPEVQQYFGNGTPVLTILSNTDAENTLCNISDANLCNILPEGTWEINWIPCGAYKSNYEIIQKDVSNFVVIITKHPNQGTINTLSFGSSNDVPFGLRYGINYYYDVNDKTLMKDFYETGLAMHFLQHLSVLREKELADSRMTSLVVTFPELLTATRLKEIVSQFQLKPDQKTPSTLLCMEQDLTVKYTKDVQ